MSKPAKLVARLSGFLAALCTAISTPGRALPAEQPHTELIITRVVPLLASWVSTASGVSNSLKPFSVSSSFMGTTICSGYIVWIFYIRCLVINETQSYQKSSFTRLKENLLQQNL